MTTLGKGVEYALHCLTYLVDPPRDTVITLAHLAEFQSVSESYLAKVFTRLAKAGLVRSAVGANGGYELAKRADQITFWDVVLAVEGGFNLFECRNIRDGCVLYKTRSVKPGWLVSGTCEIHAVMLDAEAKVQEALRWRNLDWLAKRISGKIPRHDRGMIAQWFGNAAGEGTRTP